MPQLVLILGDQLSRSPRSGWGPTNPTIPVREIAVFAWRCCLITRMRGERLACSAMSRASCSRSSTSARSRQNPRARARSRAKVLRGAVMAATQKDRLAHALPYQQLVVGRHGVVGGEGEARPLTQRLEVIEIAQTHLRIALAQGGIEGTIAVAGEAPADIERTVETERRAGREQRSETGEHGAHFWPAHDVRRVGAEGRIHRRRVRPRLRRHVEQERRSHVVRTVSVDPGMNGGVMLRPIARVPDETGQRSREIYGVLAGSGSDFEHAAPAREHLPQHFEYGLAIALAGSGERQLTHGPLHPLLWVIAQVPEHPTRGHDQSSIT